MEGWPWHPSPGVLLALSSLVLLFSNNQVDSLIAKGTINTEASLENWVFLTRFCFLSDKGRLQFKLRYPVNFSTENVILYHDDQWPLIYGVDPPKSCMERESVLSTGSNQVINLTSSYVWSGCERVMDANGVEMYECAGGRTFKSSRERWWFIALDNCASTKGLRLEYELTMTNADLDDFFFAHFSADEFYILQVDIAFLVIYVVLLGMSVMVAVMLSNRQLLHVTYRMYMASVACEFFAIVFFCAYYGDYGRTGIPKDGIKYVARFFEAVGVMIFLLTLILIAKGYTITRGRLSSSGTIKIAVFMTIYVVVYIVLFIVESEVFDPGLVLYIYESAPGYGLIALRLIGWVWFCYAMFFTLKHYPEKNLFYYPLFVFYTLWFLSAPALAAVSSGFIDKWVREKSVHSVERLVEVFGHTIFLILTRPTAANSNFPYHVKTTQIGIMQGSNDFPMQGHDNFAAHPYAVDERHSGGVDLFFTAHTSNINVTTTNGMATNGMTANGMAANGMAANGMAANGNPAHMSNGHGAGFQGSTDAFPHRSIEKGNIFLTDD